MNTEKHIMRIGIISDVQMNTYSQDWGERNLEKAFAMLSGMDIDFLFHVGDLANNTELEVFHKYIVLRYQNQILSSVCQLVLCYEFLTCYLRNRCYHNQ